MVLRALLVLGSFLFVLAVAEGALRLYGYRYQAMHVALPDDPNDYRSRHAFSDTHFEYDPVLIWRPRKGVPPFNDEGFRGAPLGERGDANTLRLFALGDSNTLGWLGVDGDPAPSWPIFLEEYFEFEGKKLRVTNAGVFGYTTFQGERLLKQLLPYKPDIVLVSFGCNDAHPVTMSDAEFVERAVSTRVSLYTGGLFRLRLAQLAASAWDRRLKREEPEQEFDPMRPLWRVGLLDYRAHLKQMAADCAARGALCVILTRPHMPPATDPKIWSYHTPAFYRATLEAAEAAGVPVIDVYAEFKEAYDLFVDDSHFTAEGHRKAAQFVSEELQRILGERAAA